MKENWSASNPLALAMGSSQILNLWRPAYNATTDGRYVNVKLALFFIVLGMVLNIAATS